MSQRLHITLAAFAAFAGCTALLSPLAYGADVDFAALVNDRALATVVYHRPETAHGIADAIEAGDDRKRTMLHLAAVTQRTAYAPDEPVEVRLIERIRQLATGKLGDQTAIWHVCRYPDRSCPVDSVIFLNETVYVATRPDHYAED